MYRPSLLEDYLLTLKGENEIVFIPNPGNAGDSLINYAEYQLFRKIGLRFKESTVDCSLSTIRNKVVLFGGGGGLIPQWQTAFNAISRLHSQTKKFIVLPSTIRGCDDLLKRFRNNDTIMCRETISFNYVSQAVSKGVQVLEIEDAALTLDTQSILNNKPKLYTYLRQELNHSLYHFRIAVQDTLRWAKLSMKHRVKRLKISNENIIFQ